MHLVTSLDLNFEFTTSIFDQFEAEIARQDVTRFG
jgi:hypothetical protein